MSALWTEEEKATLLRMWPTESARQIAKILNKSRNAIIGMAHRMQIPSKKKPKPAPAPKTPPVSRVVVISRPPREAIPVEQPRSESGVPLLDASPGQCRAIIGSTDARNETVMVCGEPIPVSSHFSFCEYHLGRYTQPPYRRG